MTAVLRRSLTYDGQSVAVKMAPMNWVLTCLEERVTYDGQSVSLEEEIRP